MKKLIGITIAIIIFVPVFLITIVPAILWRSFVITKLWAWFVIPTFGLPELSILVATGLVTLVTSLPKETNQNTQKNTNEDGSNFVVEYITASFITPALALGVGYIITLFM